MGLEDTSGLQVLSMLKLDGETRGIPVLTYTTDDDGEESDEPLPETSETDPFKPRTAVRMN
jgi:hypothetical protein